MAEDGRGKTPVDNLETKENPKESKESGNVVPENQQNGNNAASPDVPRINTAQDQISPKGSPREDKQRKVK